MAWVLYHKWLEAQIDGGVANTPVDFGGDTLKIALVGAGYTPAQSTHDLFDDADSNEVSGVNYTSGGETLASKTVTESSGTVTFDNTVDITWSQDASGFSDARYAILYKDSGAAATSPLIAYADLGGNKGNQDGDLTLEFDAAGIITWS